MHRHRRPVRATVIYRGIPYAINLECCRRALIWREVEGEVDNLEHLATRVGLSRSTVSRFFSGRSTTLGTTLRILTALRLDFRDVASPLGPDEGP
jgi:transcriptional regulator with XRE-family HTH domain